MNRSLGHLHLVVKEFLNRKWDQKSPLLIGYSGGGDSKALLHCALQWGKAPLHLAHIDHGWREESRQEALLLKKEAAELGLPFHTIRLKCLMGENEARDQRLAYFSELQKKYSFQAVLLGHHANDHAETALKRVFEGAAFTRLSGIKEESCVKNVLLWRPLLKVKKEKIEQYLFSKKLTFFDDPSNRNPKYLRSRMRGSLLPSLEEIFGKSIVLNLQLLADRSEELSVYLSERVKPLFERVLEGKEGFQVDCGGSNRVEVRFFLQEILRRKKLKVSRQQLERLVVWVLQESGRKDFKINEGVFKVEGSVFCFKWNVFEC